MAKYCPDRNSLVDPLDLKTVAGAHADIVLDHETRQFFAIDQDDPLGTSLYVVPCGFRENGGGDEYALGPTCCIDGAREVAESPSPTALPSAYFLACT
ncbi:MAG: hypothetical protein OXN89_05020 [Bryobacterales bacterium]|nr:hypothetical protein [Bryobacterales bacterium]